MLRRHTIEPRFYDTYRYADVVQNLMDDPFEYAGLLEEFYCDGQVAGLVAPYERESAFHAFLSFVVDRLIHEAMAEVELDECRALAKAAGDDADIFAELDPFTLPVEQAFKRHGIEFGGFGEWLKDRNKTFATAEADDIGDYFADLRLEQSYDDLMTKSVREVFFVLFGNRERLLGFNEMIARQVQRLEESDQDEAAKYFERPGVLKRAYMPEWVRTAVFFRDRGRCVACRADLSGLVSVWSEENFDHMVPLASGGLNDVTNIQLLCGACNRKKADRAGFTSSTYEDWYPMSDESSA